MNFAHGETVTVIYAGTTADPYSGEPDGTESWADADVTKRFIAGVGVEPRVVGSGDSAEPVMDARNAVTSGYTLYMPTGTSVSTKNRVTVRGETYDVIGEPAVWRSPFTGWAAGIVVQVSHKEG